MSYCHSEAHVQSQHFLIAGGGIAGLTHALTLSRAGHRVQVLEQAAALVATGAGIQLGPNALRRLDQLGLLDALYQLGAKPNAVSIRDLASGNPIKQLDLFSIEKRYGYPILCIHRADLQQVLIDACEREPNFSLLTQRRLQSVQNMTAGVSVQCGDSDGGVQTLTGNALIGADGLWSRVREQLIGDGPPTTTGKIAFRALIPLHDLIQQTQINWVAKQTGLWLGANAHVVHYPIGAHLNIVVMMRGASLIHQWDHAATIQSLFEQVQLAHPAPIAKQLGQLLGAIQTCSVWTLFDRPAIRRWHDGNICLTGDAAHPMQAHLAQGASMAIEDAFAMRSAIQTNDSPSDAFAAFAAQRFTRTSLAMRKAKQYGNIYQAAWPVSAARNLFLKSPLSNWNCAGMDWLYRN